MPTPQIPQTLAILSAPEDAPFVAQLRADLSAADYAIIDVASERLHEDPCSEPGELRRRLEPAHAVLVVLSPQAAQSEQVRCEIEFARLLDPAERPRQLVPLLIAATDVPYSVRNLHTIYFTAGPYDAALERLKAHLAANPAAEAEFAEDFERAWSAAPAPRGPAAVPAPATSPAIAGMPAPAPSTYTPPVPAAPIATIAPPPEPPTQPLPPRAPVADAGPVPAAARVVTIQSAEAPSASVSPQSVPPAPDSSASAAPPKRRPFWRALFSRG